MNLIWTKQGLMELEFEELQKHKKETWEYYTMVKKVLNFRELDE